MLFFYICAGFAFGGFGRVYVHSTNMAKTRFSFIKHSLSVRLSSRAARGF